MEIGARVKEMRVEIWATPNEGVSLRKLVRKLRKLGNEVLQIDAANNRVLIAQEAEQWR